MSSPASGANQGIYRYRMGDIRATALHDGVFRRPLDGLVRNASLDEVRAALAEGGLPSDALTITFTPLLLEHAGEVTLIDTGYGEFGAETNGFMLENLKVAGLSPDDIDNVVISHFHPDHINGLRRKDGSEVFPRARVLIPQAEWDFWMTGGATLDLPEAAIANRKNVERVFAAMADRVEKFVGDQEILPGITALAAPGHTPGHSAFRLSSSGKDFLVMSDVTSHPALFVRRPDWSPSFDMIPDLAIATRKRFLGFAADNSLQVAFFHAPFPATGLVEKAQNGFRFMPLATA